MSVVDVQMSLIHMFPEDLCLSSTLQIDLCSRYFVASLLLEGLGNKGEIGADRL